MTGNGTIGGDELHVRSLDRLTSETLVAEGVLNIPFFSPDGASVGFQDENASPRVLKRVSVEGGPASTICDLPGDLTGASWGADGTIVFAIRDATPGLWRVPAVGGEPEQLTVPDPEQGEVGHFWPEILPGGEAVLFTVFANTIEETQIAVLSLETGERKVVLRGGSYPRYSPTGHLLYGVQGVLWAVAFDLSRLETVGDPVPVQEGVLTKAGRGAADFSVSENGSLIYVPEFESENARTVVWVDRQGREERLAGLEPRGYESIRLSSDGNRLAMDLDRERLWTYDIGRGVRNPLTTESGVQDRNPDGQWIAYHSDVSGEQEIYVQRFPMLGDRQQISIGGGRSPIWSPDGRELFYRSTDGRQVVAVPIASEPTLTAGSPEVLFEGPYFAADGVLRPYDPSPDGERFVMVKVGGETGGEAVAAAEITVVIHWHQELLERVPVP